VTGSQPHLSIKAKSGRKPVKEGGTFEDDYARYCSWHKEEKKRVVDGGHVMFCMPCIDSNKGRQNDDRLERINDSIGEIGEGLFCIVWDDDIEIRVEVEVDTKDCYSSSTFGNTTLAIFKAGGSSERSTLTCWGLVAYKKMT
jgi:hypothetical protein